MNREATIIGSFIYIILMNLDKLDLHKGSVARLRGHIFAKLKKAPIKYAKEADELWERIVTDNPEKFELYISPVIETLFFNHEDKMIEMYGKDFGLLVTRATMKMAYGDKEDVIRRSYLVADSISKEVKLSLF